MFTRQTSEMEFYAYRQKPARRPHCAPCGVPVFDPMSPNAAQNHRSFGQFRHFAGDTPRSRAPD